MLMNRRRAAVGLQPPLLLLLATVTMALLIALVPPKGLLANKVKEEAQALAQRQVDESNPLSRRRAIFFSEAKLRAVVEMTNLELRQLKRDFMKQMTDVYLRLKLDSTVGYEQARDYATHAASANVLIAEEFSSIVIKKHIIQRRLLTGLKLAFVKFLPMQTLVNLYRRYKSFEWLKDQEQVELRPKFPEAKEKQFVILYSLIELRARVRAADDVLALTTANLRRVLQTVQWYLVESKHGSEVSGGELSSLAANAKAVMQYYLSEVLEWRQELHSNYETFLKEARPLAQMLGGQSQLIEFIDRLIDVEALDIDLNEQAQSLEFPPTINEQMIQNVQKRWIPWYVLKSLEEDRKVLVENRKRVMHLVRLDPGKRDADLAEWLANLLDYVCHNDVTYYGNGFGR